tara:strand:+ start:50 stop:604 length:555 start_codon:yes stop_codon:yes gene_type:complete
MKKLVFIVLVFIMFFFKNLASANYDKVFYDLQINSISGEIIDFSKYKDKAVLVVNTASYCGFTKQYEGLQKLWEKYESKGLIVLGIPSDSFNQEKKSNKEVKEFCEVNFDITFPLTTITDVKGENAHEIFKWAKDNYGKSAIPKWNFYKILINKEGKIEDTFSSLTKPTSQKIIQKIEKTLKIY